ncbi:MAG: glycosyltransferase [bacterium]|nr:glycosyltransferase [bacterium]
MRTALRVSVIIVSYRHGPTLPSTLRSLRLLGRHLEEVLLVDNAGDLTDAVWRELPDSERCLLRPGANLGFAGGVNLAASRAAGDLMMLLSPDAEILRLDPARLWKSFGSGVGAVGALTVTREERPSVSWGEFPGIRRAVRRVTALKARFNRRALDRLLDGHRVEVAWILGAAMLVPREVFRAIGGLDEAYVTAGEDQDFGARLRAAGYRAVVSPSWVVRHEPRDAGRGPSLNLIRRNELDFLGRHGGTLDRLLWFLAFGRKAAGANEVPVPPSR